MGDWMDELYTGDNGDTFSSATAVKTGAPYQDASMATPADRWGSGRDLDPFLAQSAPAGDLTPEEAAELARRSQGKGSAPKESGAQVVPGGNGEDSPGTTDHGKGKAGGGELTDGPDVQGVTPEGADTSDKSGIRARLTNARGRARSVRSKVGSPVAGKLAAAKESVRFSAIKQRRWSFVWAVIASWLIGPQFFIAVYDRMMWISGQQHLMSGAEPMGFGFTHGPGRWMRDVMAQAWQTGGTGHILLCAAFGIVPLLLLILASNMAQAAKWLIGAAVFGPVAYMLGVSYAGWTLTWGDIYLVGLFSSAFYCTQWAREKEPGFVRFTLLIPLASVLSGVLLGSTAV